jgi:hypothetical protein
MALDSSQLKQDVEIIERNIRQLDGKYNDFFDGVIALEPKELRAQTETLVRRWQGKPIANTMLKFKFRNIEQRYKLYREKWDRKLRAKLREEREEFFS